MDDGLTDDIECLISQRQGRPQFARTISWEFGNAALYTGTGKKLKSKPKRKVSDGIDDFESDDGGAEGNRDRLSTIGSSQDSSSEDSEYYSTVEDEYHLEDISDSRCTSLSTDEPAPGIGETDIVDCIDNAPHTGRRRRRSKRQRKRHQEEYVAFADNLHVLGDLYNLNIDIDDAFEEASQAPQQRMNEVPSLAELCIETSRKLGQNEKQLLLLLPDIVKQDVSNWRHEKALLHQQLKWLQNHILPFIDNPENVKPLLFHTKSKKDSKTTDYCVSKFILPTRNVWNYLPRSLNLFWNLWGTYTSGNAPSFLLHVDLQEASPEDLLQLHQEYKDYYSGLAMRTVTTLSALATTIDLMLPATVSDRNLGRRNVNEEELLKNARKNMILHVRHALHSRFPRVVDELYDRAIPYVMWARGNVGLATDLFRYLVQTEKRSRHKAMYLSEIARMNVMFGDPATAVTFYKLASEAATEKPYFDEEDMPEVWIQTHILRAHIHDNGVLTAAKALESSCSWLGAVNVPSTYFPLTSTVVAAMQAFLCYHAYHWAGGQWVDEALSRIRLWGRAHPYLHYLAAMLLALDGKARESKAAYGECRDSLRDAPGLSFLQLPSAIIKKYKNPWQPLVTMVTNQKDPVLPLEVAWRTQLVTPSLTNKRRCIEAHIASVPLDLRLDPEGHVTGDMMMVLPPLRNIVLDPYTGSVVVNRVPSSTAVWNQSFFPQTDFLIDELYIPTRHLIYSNQNGTMVHLEKMGTMACQLDRKGNSTHATNSMVLYWRSGNQVGKINVIWAVKKYIIEELIHDIEKTYTTKEWQQEMIDLVPICVGRNLDINIDTLYYACERRKKASKKKKKKKKSGKIRQEIDKYWYLPKKPILKICQTSKPVVFGDSILIQFRKTDDRDYNMFVRTESKAAFLDYNLQNNAPFRHVASPRFPYQYQLDQTDRQIVMMTGKNSNENILVFYDGRGDCICELKNTAGEGTQVEEGCPCIIGNYLYAIAPRDERDSYHVKVVRKTRISRDVNEQFDSSAFFRLAIRAPDIFSLKVVGTTVSQYPGKLLVVHTTLGLSFMHPDTLALVPIDVQTRSEMVMPLNEDRTLLRGTFESFNILSEQYYNGNEEAMSRFAVAIEFNLLVFDMQYHSSGSDSSQSLHLVAMFTLPGIPQEARFIGKLGLLVTCAHDNSTHHQLLHFTLDGRLCGILPCLGPGPRSFLPVYRHGNTEQGQGQAGWVVYMRDGHGGILCVRLQQG